jgi:hypothetical protein
MGWGTLLAALVVGCPPTRVVYHGPELCCLQAVPPPMIVYEVPYCVQTIPSPALALVPVPVDPLSATTAILQDKTQPKAEGSVTEAVAATEMEGDDEEESVLEDAAFGPGGFAGQRSLDHLSLGWGVSTIGNGTLYPVPTSMGYSGGFGGVGGGGSGGGEPFAGSNSGTNWNMINNVLPPISIVCPCAPPVTKTNPPGDPNQVPEPTSLAAFGLAAALAAWARRRRV